MYVYKYITYMSFSVPTIRPYIRFDFFQVGNVWDFWAKTWRLEFTDIRNMDVRMFMKSRNRHFHRTWLETWPGKGNILGY